MNDKNKLFDEITTLLTSFQSIFFGISENTVLAELDRRMGSYDKAEATRFLSAMLPLVPQMLARIEKYQRPMADGEIIDENSFDIERLARDVATGLPDAEVEYIERIGRQIVYWRYLR